jgi:hypothetical protein
LKQNSTNAGEYANHPAGEGKGGVLLSRQPSVNIL